MKARLTSSVLCTFCTWSLRRMRRKVRLWTSLLRLVVDDWTVALYIVIPAAAVLAYVLFRYYRGDFTAGLQPTTHVWGPVTLQTLVPLVLMVLFLFGHVGQFGELVFPLESGDRLFVLLSPMRKRWLLTALWLEGFVWQLPEAALYVLLTYPLLQVFGVRAVTWGIALVVIAAYETTVRMASCVWNPKHRFTVSRWLGYNALRLLTFFPIGRVINRVWSGHPGDLLWLTPLTVLLTLAAGVMLVRKDWDAFSYQRPSGALSLVIPPDQDSSLKIHFWMRRPSQWLVHRLERLRKTPLRPITWLIATRALRRRGLVRELLWLTVGVVTALNRIPVLWVKGAALACAVLLLGEWWNFVIRPLYESAAKEQTVCPPWSLMVDGQRIKVSFLAVAAILWLIVGWVSLWIVR
jgi:ABC-2 type transport system permease protein